MGVEVFLAYALLSSFDSSIFERFPCRASSGATLSRTMSCTALLGNNDRDRKRKSGEAAIFSGRSRSRKTVGTNLEPSRVIFTCSFLAGNSTAITFGRNIMSIETPNAIMRAEANTIKRAEVSSSNKATRRDPMIIVCTIFTNVKTIFSLSFSSQLLLP